MGVGADTLSTLITLKNSNTTYGASHFTYELTFYDVNGAPITSLRRDSFIYPGQIKRILETGLPIPIASVNRTAVQLAEVEWKPIAEFSLPRIQLRDVRFDLHPDTRELVATGLVRNDNPFRISRLTVIAVVSGTARNPLAASKTFVEDVAPFEQRFFQVIVPRIDLPAITPDLVDLFADAQR
mgnify:CR=1 FL=1